MRVLVCGGRDYQDAVAVHTTLETYNITHLITGGADGVDQLAKEWAERNEVSTHIYRAQWRKFGKAAGPRRNQHMLDDGKPDFVIAFPGGRGTADMVRRGKDAGLLIIMVDEG